MNDMASSEGRTRPSVQPAGFTVPVRRPLLTRGLSVFLEEAVRSGMVRNWEKFQHYSKRRPPWIKLHREIMDDYEFQMLSLAAKALAPCIWLIASEGEKGRFRADSDYLAFRTHIPEDVISQAIDELERVGFIRLSSVPLAEGFQPAPESLSEVEGEVETEREKRRGERSHNASENGKGYNPDDEAARQSEIIRRRRLEAKT